MNLLADEGVEQQIVERLRQGRPRPESEVMGGINCQSSCER